MRRNRTRNAGFTLLEMLIALALLSLIATLILAAIQGTGRALDVANRQVQNNSIGSAQLVLRQILSQAQPIKFSADQPENARMLDGGSATVRLITSFAAGGQYGGLNNCEIRLAPSATNWDLVIQETVFRRASPGAAIAPAIGRPITILKSIATISWRYFGRANADDIGPGWSPGWISSSRLPTLVALDVTFPQGDPRIWPELIVAVRAAE